MRRGFNRYGNDGQEESHNDPNDQNGGGSNNFNLINQFAGFAPNNGFGDGMIMTLFQVVEQQSRALQSLMEKVDTITQRTIELTDKIRDLKYLTHHTGRISVINARLISSRIKRQEIRVSKLEILFKPHN